MKIISCAVPKKKKTFVQRVTRKDMKQIKGLKWDLACRTLLIRALQRGEY